MSKILIQIAIFLLMIFSTLAKTCIRTFDREKSYVTEEMNQWLSFQPDIKIIDIGYGRSDDDYHWYTYGHIAYEC